MDWKTIIPLVTLASVYVGSVWVAIRSTNNTIANTIGKRIDDLRGDVKKIEVEIQSSNNKFVQHLNAFHSNTPEERNLWKPYFDS